MYLFTNIHNILSLTTMNIFTFEKRYGWTEKVPRLQKYDQKKPTKFILKVKFLPHSAVFITKFILITKIYMQGFIDFKNYDVSRYCICHILTHSWKLVEKEMLI